MTGVENRLRSCETQRPPTMVMPSGRRSSEPAPRPMASGTAPNSAASVVIRIGRKRSRQARWIAVLRVEPLDALGLEREVDHHDRVLLDDAEQQHDADERDDAEVDVQNTSSAISAPSAAEGSVERMVIGWMRLSYSMPSTT